jgi:hypothetical protein
MVAPHALICSGDASLAGKRKPPEVVEERRLVHSSSKHRRRIPQKANLRDRAAEDRQRRRPQGENSHMDQCPKAHTPVGAKIGNSLARFGISI